MMATRIDVHAFRALGVVACTLAIAELAACGNARPEPAVIHVGTVPITRRAVEHWTSIVTHGALAPNLTGSAQPAARQQALAFLISSAWVDGEAKRYRLQPSAGEIARLVADQRRTSPDGAAGFKAALAESGQTLADVEAEATAKLAAGALEHRLKETVDAYARAHVDDRVVVDYYRAHLRRYRLPERRYYDLYESIPTKADATALASKLRSGKPVRERPNKEKPFRPENFRNLPGRATVYRAVFATRETNVVIGPEPLQGSWCVFILRRILPARLRPLSEVRRSIERKLEAPLKQRERAREIAAYRRGWLAQTDCRPGYVVQKCRQFKGRSTPEPDPFTGF